mgnify:FL=1
MKGAEQILLDELARMQRQMDRLFEDMISPGRGMSFRQSQVWHPPTDVYETDGRIVVKVEIAGMSDGDFTISLSNRTLTITGHRSDPEAKLSYQQLEIRYGDFRTEVYLPWPVADDEIEATYEDGFLTVVLPKVQPRKVPVSVRS